MFALLISCTTTHVDNNNNNNNNLLLTADITLFSSASPSSMQLSRLHLESVNAMSVIQSAESQLNARLALSLCLIQCVHYCPTNNFVEGHAVEFGSILAVHDGFDVSFGQNH